MHNFDSNDGSQQSIEEVGVFSGAARVANLEEDDDPDFDKDFCEGDLEENLDDLNGSRTINQRTARMAHFGASEVLFHNANNQADYHLSRMQRLDMRAQRRENIE